ncbi:MAG: hypothetical protein CMH35_06980 [Microbacterium sp.]|nr:hypothetical protein [Microbacterium sp.]
MVVVATMTATATATVTVAVTKSAAPWRAAARRPFRLAYGPNSGWTRRGRGDTPTGRVSHLAQPEFVHGRRRDRHEGLPPRPWRAAPDARSIHARP